MSKFLTRLFVAIYSVFANVSDAARAHYLTFCLWVYAFVLVTLPVALMNSVLVGWGAFVDELSAFRMGELLNATRPSVFRRDIQGNR